MNKLIALAAAAIAASTQASAEPRKTASAKAEADGTQPQTVRRSNGRVARVSRPVAGGVAPACPANVAREDCPRPARLKNVTEIAQILAD